MSDPMEEFRGLFIQESFEGLDAMEELLVDFESIGDDPEAINTIFRAAHSIKGGAGTFGFSEVSATTHLAETLLDEVRNGRMEITRELTDALLATVDCVRGMLTASTNAEPIDPDQAAATEQRLAALLNLRDAADSDSAGAANAATDTNARPGDPVSRGWHIRLRPDHQLLQTGIDMLPLIAELGRLGDLRTRCHTQDVPLLDTLDPHELHLNWVFELHTDVAAEAIREVFEWVEDEIELVIEPLAGAMSEATADAAPATDTRGDASASGSTAAPDTTRAAEAASDRRAGGDRRKGDRRGGSDSIRVAIDKVDALVNMVGELVITQAMLKQFEDSLGTGSFAQQLRDGLAQLERNTRELQESVMSIRMLPISFAFNRFPRMVRDLSDQLGKRVRLEIVGEQTELDKNVLEQINDPLTHLVRNALDHGLELPDVRRAAGKSIEGTLRLEARHEGGHIIIEIADDGNGIDCDAVLARAIERGLVAPDDRLDESQIHELLFAPGFSTAAAVTDLSGRGVGMDVVRRNIKSLGGQVEVASQQGTGSTFTIRLPLTLAIADGQLLRVGREVYVMPLVAIVESLQIEPPRLARIADGSLVYRVRDEYVPLLRFESLFGVETEAKRPRDGLLVIIEADGRQAGLFVDELLGQQQFVIKSLEANYGSVPGLSGATILGDGTVALILDAPGVMALPHMPTEFEIDAAPTDEQTRLVRSAAA